MISKMSVTQKTSAAFMVLASICAVAGGANIVNVNAAKEENNSIRDLRVSLDTLFGFERELNNHAFVGDSFLLTSDADAQKSFEAARDELNMGFNLSIEQLEQHSPELVDSLNEAHASWKKFAYDWMGNQINLMNRPETIDLARAREGEGEGRRILEDTHVAMGAVLAGLSEKAEASASRSDANLQSIYLVVIIATLATLLASVGMGFMFHRMLSRPLSRISDTTKMLASGDLNVNIPYNSRGDEIGDLSKALSVFQINLVKTQEMEKEQQAAAARAEEERRKILQEVVTAFEQQVMGSIGDISQAITNLQAMTEEVTAGAQKTDSSAYEVSGATEISSQNITTVAGAAEEMSATIQEIAFQVTKAASTAQEGSLANSRVTGELESLTEIVGNIESVVSLISDIAEQTNLLALNATIEAARAGDMGKGFAVVASEVKNLASQTANATEDVSRQIAQVREATHNVVGSINVVSKVVADLDEISTSISTAMEEQTATTREIAHSVEQAAVAASSVSSSITSVSEIARMTKGASTQIAEEAVRMSGQAKNVQERAADFVKKLQAG